MLAEKVPAPIPDRGGEAATWKGVGLEEVARLPLEAVIARLGSAAGLPTAEARARLAEIGPNALRSHHASPLAVVSRQLRSPLLILLLVTAFVSFFVGDRTNAVIIGIIVGLSVALGFVNEYRAERAAEALHEQMRHSTLVRRDGQWTSCDLTELVPGDLVRLEMGSIVPADVRISSAASLECDESVLTGESLPVEKTPDPVEGAASLADMTSCAFMGTIVHAGVGEAVVVSTGPRTEFGKIAVGLGDRQEETEFQHGLREFSLLLAEVAGVLTASILVINLLLARPVIDAVLFSLAIAVGITPQLLPAVVTTSLATGSRRLAQRKVLVKRLVVIEDLGNIGLLLTDKTGTLTEGHITFRDALDAKGSPSASVLLWGLVCNEAEPSGASGVGANPLDAATWDAPGADKAPVSSYSRVAIAPFDHDRRRMSVLVDGPEGRVLVAKGAPEGIVDLCAGVGDAAREVLQRGLDEGSRIVAVATRPAPELATLSPDDETGLELAGFLVFLDQPKETAAVALRQLDSLGIKVKILTGDHPIVAEKVCRQLGLAVTGTLTGAEIDALDDEHLAGRLTATTIFSRVSPGQKSRIIRACRALGSDVAYLGDGVNDAVALHHADVGISVDSATDVAKDAADIVLLEKDLGVLADGVMEGRRIFANTIKYVLMGTSSNFGNMFSAAAASAFLSFLPMLPSQILMNNLLYDTSQMSIPTDRVDEEQLAQPSHWDLSFIRRFMLLFGPISSIFDFMTFAVMLHVFKAGPPLFRSGWFVESLATQTLVIFVIRTRRVPFVRSRPSAPLAAASLTAVLIGAVLPTTPWAHTFGFTSLPAGYFGALVAMIGGYLLLAEAAKYEFYRHREHPVRVLRPRSLRRIHRRAFRFSQRRGAGSGGQVARRQ